GRRTAGSATSSCPGSGRDGSRTAGSRARASRGGVPCRADSRTWGGSRRGARRRGRRRCCRAEVAGCRDSCNPRQQRRGGRGRRVYARAADPTTIGSRGARGRDSRRDRCGYAPSGRQTPEKIADLVSGGGGTEPPCRGRRRRGTMPGTAVRSRGRQRPTGTRTTRARNLVDHVLGHGEQRGFTTIEKTRAGK